MGQYNGIDIWVAGFVGFLVGILAGLNFAYTRLLEFIKKIEEKDE